MHIILPTLIISAFKAINFHELLCPVGHQIVINDTQFDLIHNYQSSEYIVKSSELNPYDITGLDCYLATFKTGCKFHYFSSNDIVQTIEKFSTDIKNCNQISNDVIMFPKESCFGGLLDNSYHYTESSHIITKPRNYMYDPSTKNILDYNNIFEKVEGKLYKYKNGKGYWIRNDDQRIQTCNMFEESTFDGLNVKVWKSKTSTSTLIDINNKVYDINDLCYHDHCGVRIAITKDHIYFKLPHTLDLKKCDNKIYEVSSETEKIESKVELTKCLEEKIDLMDKRKIRYDSLKRFIPSEEGIYPVYKIGINNTLLKAIAKYEEVKIDEFERYNKWIQCGNKSKCSYNGIIKANLTDLYGTKMRISEFKIHLDEIEKGIFVYQDKEHTTSDHETEDMVLSGENSFLQLIKLIGPWIAEFIIVLIVIKVVLKCIFTKKSFKKKKNNILMKNLNKDFDNW